jgi:hypothetical protein
MSKTIQIRDVPERLHSTLKTRAAREGMSLSDFIKTEFERTGVPDCSAAFACCLCLLTPALVHTKHQEPKRAWEPSDDGEAHDVAGHSECRRLVQRVAVSHVAVSLLTT